MELSDSLIQARLEAFTNALDAGTGGGKLRFYSGPQQMPKGAAISTQTLLAEFVFSNPSKASYSGNTLTLTDPVNAQALAAGIIVWARFVDGDDTFVADCSVSEPSDATSSPPTNGVPHGTGDVIIDNTQVYAGGEIDMLTIAFSEA